MRIGFLQVALLLALSACSSAEREPAEEPIAPAASASYAADAAAGGGDYDMAEMGAAASAPAPAMEPGGGGVMMQRAAKPRLAKADADRILPMPQPIETNAQPSELETLVAADRRIHYDGSVNVQVKDPKVALANISATVRSLGGYVESESLTSASYQVPVKNFFAAYERALGLGKVLDKSLTAQDLTEAYSDLSARQKLLHTTLTRFEELLRGSHSIEERLVILGEIKRLKERLAYIETSLEQLAFMSEYSKLAVGVVPEQTNFQSLASFTHSPFYWVRTLSPTSEAVASMGRRLEWQAPVGFVPIKGKTFWMAESATKAAIRTTRLPNEPQGDATFWANAIRYHFEKADHFEVRSSQANDFHVVVMTDPLAKDAAYLVALRVKGNDVELVEATFPTKEDSTRFQDAVIEALKNTKA